eukprot:5393014-Alexandrium_andersonii.AAC.1
MIFPIASLRAPGKAWARFAEKALEVQLAVAKGRLQLQTEPCSETAAPTCHATSAERPPRNDFSECF